VTAAPTPIESVKAVLAADNRVADLEAGADGSLRFLARSSSRSWLLRMTLDAGGGLPCIQLLDDPLIGSLAHVNYEGTVCVTDNEGLSIDSTRPAAVAARYLDEALERLEQSLQRYSAGDYTALLDEFEGYWFSLPKHRSVDVHFALDDRVREITACVDRNRQCVAFTETRQHREIPYAGLQRLRAFNRERALYIPLAQPVMPPGRNSPLGMPRIHDWVFDSLSAAGRLELDKLLRSWPRKVSAAYLLLSQPRPAGGRSAFGVELMGRQARHPLLAPTANWSVRALVVHRHSAADLRPRGGASETLAQAHIAVIGCGSVGARVAEQLALIGVGRLSLVDFDVLQPENLYRHVLGGEACGLAKVSGMKRLLEQRLPQVEVLAESQNLAAWATPERMAQVDAIVLAIGKPHIERDFIRRTRGSTALKGPIVTTWLEAMGVGGHAQRTLPGAVGCLECLYTGPDGRSLLIPRVAFVEPKEGLSRNLTGCAGAFTPYSALDATQTALLAARLVTATLTGERLSTYDCWRGTDRELLAAGFASTPWFNALDDAKLQLAVREYSRVHCPVCGGSK
jgi:molybdopterin/thiamine biosynthesis adenylyltransferase